MDRRKFLSMIIRLPVIGVLAKYMPEASPLDEVYRSFADHVQDPMLNPTLKTLAIEIKATNGASWFYEQLIEKLMECEGWMEMNLVEEREPHILVELVNDVVDKPKVEIKTDPELLSDGSFELMIHDE